jgi:allantoate deiminase
MMRSDEIIARCRRLAAFSEIPDGLLRTFLSPPLHAVHALLRDWMEAAGMHISTDAAGNLRGVYPGQTDSSRRLLLGSHLDTVPHAGPFDGALGVLLALALVESLGGRRLPFAIEVAAFSGEEGVRFGVPFLGSRALAGTLDAPLLAQRDSAGTSVEQAIRAFNLDPAALPEARLADSVFAYLEFHLEPGPVLDSLGLPLGVVTSIAGLSRLTVTFHGQADYAGATPMHLRRDALAAAARWIALVERYSRATPRLAATVGTVEVSPGAAGIVPGRVRASLDVRHPDDSVRRRSTAVLLDDARRIAARCGVTADWQSQAENPATVCDPTLVAALARAVSAAGSPVHRMTSGAAHSAMILAWRVPAAMLLLRSPRAGGHDPDQTVIPADVDAALAAGVALLEHLPQFFSLPPR